MNDNSHMKKVEDADKALQNIVELTILYDFYGELLGEHKKEIFGEYIIDDLSLGEIAQDEGISRQGVYDIIKRCSVKLRDYEKKLGLVKRFESIKTNAERIQVLAELIRNTSDEQERSRAADCIDALAGELIDKIYED